MLRVYVAADCPASLLAIELVERVRAKRPDLPLEIVNIETPGIEVPDEIFGTPTYTWGKQILFLGNPGETALIAWLEEHNGRTNRAANRQTSLPERY